MIKWIKGFIAGISSIALLISFGLVIFYRALVEDMRNSSRRCYGISYSNYHRKRRGTRKNDLWDYLYCNRNYTYR